MIADDTGLRDLRGRPALVVEDNLIIALDAADHLAALGCDPVHTAATVADALALVEGHEIAIAMVDANLGSELSVPVAARLDALGVPFVLATGETGSPLGAFPNVPVLSKPYGTDALQAALAAAIEARA